MIKYINLMKKILDQGLPQSDTISLFGETLEFDLIRDGFPLVTTRKINYKAAFGELACFLKGQTDVRFFIENGVNFWKEDCGKSSWKFSGKKKDENGFYSLSIKGPLGRPNTQLIKGK